MSVLGAWPPAGGGALALIAAILLGLRHATDPDHLTAVSTLVLGGRRGAREAAALGLAWGLGHGATLFLCGLPVILFRRTLPPVLIQGAETAIGGLIVVLAVRLLVRWRRGEFHTHPHRHGGAAHAHPHVHERRGAEAHGAEHRHAHVEVLGRSPLAAFGIGLMHGAGGSAAVGLLLVGAVSGPGRGVAALGLFAAATALSMALVSAGFGWMLTRAGASRRLEACVPVFALGGIAFGAWYALDALGLALL